MDPSVWHIHIHASTGFRLVVQQDWELNRSPVRSVVFALQIAELKRGAEIIVCTPGRMIDMLGANSGEFTHPDPLIIFLECFKPPLRLLLISVHGINVEQSI